MKPLNKILQLSALVLLLLATKGCFVREHAVRLEDLVTEMTDRGALTEFPDPPYVCKQFSSYNRTSVKPGDYTWFANLDNNYFIRVEENQGRREFVLFDAEGPGAVVRFWATFSNYKKTGILRFYFDNETDPRIEGEAMDIISGGKLVDWPLSFSVSEETEYLRRGHNLYLPIPYGKHLKITYESPGIKEARDGVDEAPHRNSEQFYYQINYRSYDPSVKVETFSMEQLESSAEVIEETLEKIGNRDRGLEGVDLETLDLSGMLGPGEEKEVSLEGEKAVRKLQLKISAADLPQALRSTVIEIAFDGKRTVWAPVGDFFATGYQIIPAATWYHEVQADGTLSVYWIMPFREKAVIRLKNLGQQEVKIENAELDASAWEWTERTMYFGSSWYQNTRIDTGLEKDRDGHGEFYDVEYARLEGKGVYVGDAVALFNCSPAWWGEGDEKIFVDNEPFPSHFGTGTEDYYGYAWCRPEPFVHPFIAQPDGSGNLSVGYTLDMRFRVLDAIPFREKLQFDMEMWHWGYTIMNHAPVTYWYIMPETEIGISPDIEGAKEPVVLHREQIFPPVMDQDGIIQGEDLVVEETTGNSMARIRPVPVPGKPKWTRSMMAWNNIGNGDLIRLRFDSEKTGKYGLELLLLSGEGKVRFSISLNGKTLLSGYTLDTSAPEEKWISLGAVDLSEGPNQLEIKMLDSEQMQRRLFGVDILQFEKY